MNQMELTTSLYNFIQTELIKQGLNEFEDAEGRLILFDKKHQFMQKIISYDDDVAKIVDDLFFNLSLENAESDYHFKKTFLLRFVNRKINRQTIEAFQLELMNVFLTNEFYINQVYQDLDKYMTGTTDSDQVNKQLNEGTTNSDHRQAYAELPQNSVNIDVNDTVMTSASDNTISRNKQSNQQAIDGNTKTESKNYALDRLVQSSQVMEQIFLTFDKKCFLQFW